MPVLADCYVLKPIPSPTPPTSTGCRLKVSWNNLYIYANKGDTCRRPFHSSRLPVGWLMIHRFESVMGTKTAGKHLISLLIFLSVNPLTFFCWAVVARVNVGMKDW